MPSSILITPYELIDQIRYPSFDGQQQYDHLQSLKTDYSSRFINYLCALGPLTRMDAIAYLKKFRQPDNDWNDLLQIVYFAKKIDDATRRLDLLENLKKISRYDDDCINKIKEPQYTNTLRVIQTFKLHASSSYFVELSKLDLTRILAKQDNIALCLGAFDQKQQEDIFFISALDNLIKIDDDTKRLEIAQLTGRLQKKSYYSCMPSLVTAITECNDDHRHMITTCIEQLMERYPSSTPYKLVRAVSKCMPDEIPEILIWLNLIMSEDDKDCDNQLKLIIDTERETRPERFKMSYFLSCDWTQQDYANHSFTALWAAYMISELAPRSTDSDKIDLQSVLINLTNQEIEHIFRLMGPLIVSRKNLCFLGTKEFILKLSTIPQTRYNDLRTFADVFFYRSIYNDTASQFIDKFLSIPQNDLQDVCQKGRYILSLAPACSAEDEPFEHYYCVDIKFGHSILIDTISRITNRHLTDCINVTASLLHDKFNLFIFQCLAALRPEQINQPELLRAKFILEKEEDLNALGKLILYICQKPTKIPQTIYDIMHTIINSNAVSNHFDIILKYLESHNQSRMPTCVDNAIKLLADATHGKSFVEILETLSRIGSDDFHTIRKSLQKNNHIYSIQTIVKLPDDNYDNLINFVTKHKITKFRDSILCQIQNIVDLDRAYNYAIQIAQMLSVNNDWKKISKLMAASHYLLTFETDEHFEAFKKSLEWAIQYKSLKIPFTCWLEYLNEGITQIPKFIIKLNSSSKSQNALLKTYKIYIYSLMKREDERLYFKAFSLISADNLYDENYAAILEAIIKFPPFKLIERTTPLFDKWEHEVGSNKERISALRSNGKITDIYTAYILKQLEHEAITSIEIEDTMPIIEEEGWGDFKPEWENYCQEDFDQLELNLY